MKLERVKQRHHNGSKDTIHYRSMQLVQLKSRIKYQSKL